MLGKPTLFRSAFPDIGAAYQRGQNIRLNNLKLDAAEEEKNKQSVLSGLLTNVSKGSPESLNTLSVRDPVTAQNIASAFASINKLSDNEKKRKLNDTKQMIGFLQMSPNKVEHDKNRPFLIDAIGIDPGEFSPDNRAFMLKQSLLLNSVLTKPEKFGKAKPFINAETGNREIYQIGDFGTPRRIEGLAPDIKSPLVNIEAEKKLSPEDQIKLKVNETRAVKGAEFDAKSFQKMVDDADKEASAAGTTISLIRAQNLIGADTGPGTELIDNARRVTLALASFVGIEDTDTFKSQLSGVNKISQFRAIQEKLVGSKLSAEPGVKTDGDAERMRNTLANISNPEEANKFISDLILSESLRKRNRANFYNEEAINGNRNSFKVRKAWNDYVDQTPLIQINKITKKAVFLSQWIEDNQGKGTKQQILEGWRNYGT